jgi:exodeoxyribonuclease-3
MTGLTLVSWNINGLRAIHKKGFLPWLEQAAPDILCLQETRVETHQLPPEIAQLDGYHTFWHSPETKKGYSGTALFTRPKPLSVQFGLGQAEFDREGRTIIAEYSAFTLLNCYFPNGSRDHSRVPFKLAFYEAFLDKCQQLRAQGRIVVFCGDVNTSHREIDLAHPKSNQNTTGFLPGERAWLDRVIEAGYVDTFRHFYPDLPGQYTWWSMPTGARARNIGWRLDYFFIAPEGLERLEAAFILPEVMGSDHCPVGIRWRVEDGG